MSKKVLIGLALIAALSFAIFIGKRELTKVQGQKQEILKQQLGNYGKAPDFQFTNQENELFSSQSLKGKVWLASFIFTSCPSVCPITTAKMAVLQKKFGKDPNLFHVSISVDPQTDTPKVLKSYAIKHRADLKNWVFLTGDEAKTHELIQKGFLLPSQGRENSNPSKLMGHDDEEEPVVHSDRFVLVDQEGMIRGYYSILEGKEFARLERDIKTLLY